MQTTPFTIAANTAKDNGWKEGAARMTTEGKIAGKLITALLAAGYTVDMNDGEETTVSRSTSHDEIMQAMFTTDEDILIARDSAGKQVGNVYLVYGNDGYDVISEYSLSLEAVLAPVEKYAEDICLA